MSQHEPSIHGYLEPEFIKTMGDFNREMQYHSKPYRMERILNGAEDHGSWALYQTRGDELLYEVPPMDEWFAVQIMVAWMQGMNHQSSIESAGRMLRGELEDEA